MKSAVIVLCFIGAVVAQGGPGGPGGPGGFGGMHDKCGSHPSKKPSDCCEGLSKVVKEDAFNGCSCGDRDFCCKGSCAAKAYGLLKNDKFDKDTAVSSLKTAFGNDPSWNTVVSKAVDDCVALIASFKDKMPTPPGAPKCDNIENGMMVMCLKNSIFLNCPKPSTDADCKATKDFFSCMMKSVPA